MRRAKAVVDTEKEHVGALHIANSRSTNPDILCAGISISPAALSEHARMHYLRQIEDRLGLPCVDPVATRTGQLVDELLRKQ